MPWDPVIDSEILAIHAALVPTDDGGDIIYFGGDQHHRDFNINGTLDAARRFPCRRGPGQRPQYVRAPTTDVFCSGHALLADGRLLIAGGTQLFPGDAVGGGHGHGEANHFPGHRHCWIYDPRDRAFTPAGPLNPEIGRPPGPDDIPGGGRWYPTLTTLPSGEVFIYAGHARNDDTRHNIGAGERYRPISNSWVMLAPTPGASAGAPDLYPRLFLANDGRVVSFSGLAGFTRCARFDPYAGGAEDAFARPAPDFYRGFACTAVMLPLLPGDQYRNRLLAASDIQPLRINLQPVPGRSAGWVNAGTRSGSAAGKVRNHALAVLLPDGRVLLAGGVQNPQDDGTAVLTPEIYTPGIDWATGTYQDGATDDGAAGTWQTLEEPSAVPRNYHSTALLMPDGRVWTAGSSRNAAPGDPATAGRLQIQIFQPPYPGGARPRITAAPSVVAYGQRFHVSTTGGAMRRMALVRCGSVTHAFDSDQRYVALEFSEAGTDRWLVTAPPSGSIAPPGPYMLFVLDDGGRPCEYAAFVRVGGEVMAFTDRSIISRDEVGGGTTIDTVFYVVFDGYRPDEVQLQAADMTCRWQGDGAVPGVQAIVEDVRRESSGIGVAQRITFVCSLRFSSNAAFNQLGGANQRTMRIDIRKNGAQAAVAIQLFRDAVPYMRDGDTPWLSMDLRVVRKRVGDRLAGVEQRSTSFPGSIQPAQRFIEEVLQEFSARPAGETHPFNAQLEGDDGSAGQLALGSHEGGQEVFNYAFAKVRFRAPSGVVSSRMRMLFRLFNTTTPSLAYNPATLYRRTGDGATATPQLYDQGGEPVLTPCFAAGRGGDLLATSDPLNVKTVTGGGVQEQVAYFGCWLDVNHAAAVRNRLRGDHQCVVAELHVQGVAIPFGASPSESSLLAQRNVAYVGSDNPGFTAASHTVQHTFELHPLGLPRGGVPAALHVGGQVEVVEQPGHGDGHVDAGPRLGADLAAVHGDAVAHGHPPHGDPANPDHGGGPLQDAGPSMTWSGRYHLGNFAADELLFTWNGLPIDSVVTVYLPDVDLDALLEDAARRPAPALFERLDDHTLRLRVLGEVTYLPLPAGRSTPIPGLLSVQLPFGVRTGRRFRVTVQHLSGAGRKVIGAFELNIPVRRSVDLLTPERRRLAALKQMRLSLSAGSRWIPIFDRYVKAVEDRVRDFGGRPDEVPASTHGAPEDRPRGATSDGGCEEENTADACIPGCEGDKGGRRGGCCDGDAGHRAGHGQDGATGCRPRPGRRVVRGHVVKVVFDGRGALHGFVLAADGQAMRLPAHGRRLGELLMLACRDGHTLAVTTGEGPCGLRDVAVECC